jgi:hypothetical protein
LKISAHAARGGSGYFKNIFSAGKFDSSSRNRASRRAEKISPKIFVDTIRGPC